MINKIKGNTHKVGMELPIGISIEAFKGLLRKGVCVKEVVNQLDHPRVFFGYGGKLYVRAIHDPLRYVQRLPQNLIHASTLDDIHLQTVLSSQAKGHRILSIMTHKGAYTSEETLKESIGMHVLKDFK